MAEVRFEHVGKRYDEVVVIEDLNLDIRDQPSGCGKSTALRMIAGRCDVAVRHFELSLSRGRGPGSGL